MKVAKDTGMLTLRNDRFGVQLYCPIISFKKDSIKLSFPTVLVISRKNWQFDWSTAFQILGFGFGVGKYKEF